MITTDKIIYEGVEYPIKTFTGVEIAEYKGLRDMYFSEGGFANGSYLHKFPRESDGSTVNGVVTPDFFGERKKRAHYENIFKPNLDAKVSAIFSKDQTRSIENEVVKTFVKNPTRRRGESMAEYQKRKLLNCKLYGAVFEVLDGSTVIPQTGINDASDAFKKWAYILTPLQVYGYNIDNGGALDCLAYYEDIERQNGDESESDVLRVWLKAVDGTIVTFLYKTEKAYDVRQLEYFPVDLIEDGTRYDTSKIAKSKYLGELSIAKAIYNTTSWFNDSFFKNCFSFLAINGRISSDVDLSNSSIFMYSGEGVNAPQYIAPPVAHLETMIKEVERMVQQLNSNMNSVLYISVMASGEARKEADKTRIQEQKQDARRLEENEDWLVNTALKNYLEFSEEYNVIYIKDYESLTKADEIEPLQGLIDSGAIKQAVIYEIGKDMIDIVYSTYPERAEELKNLQDISEDETQNDTFDNPPEIDE